MKLLVGETYVLDQLVALWQKYPVEDVPTIGHSYQTFHPGDVITLVDVGKYKETELAYVVDSRGAAFVVGMEYLRKRIRM